MEGCEGELGEFERGIREDGFVGEDLGRRLVWQGEEEWVVVVFTMPIVARVLMAIQSRPVMNEPFGSGWFSNFSFGRSSSSS